MEIERKFLLQDASVVNRLLEEATDAYHIEQAYVCAEPVIRVRHAVNDSRDRYILTVKGKGNLVREEIEWDISRESYEQLKAKHSGRILKKTRYTKALDDAHTLELDIFEGELKGLVLAEIEFSDIEDMMSFEVPAYLSEDVSEDPRYKNVSLAMFPESI